MGRYKGGGKGFPVLSVFRQKPKGKLADSGGKKVGTSSSNKGGGSIVSCAKTFHKSALGKKKSPQRKTGSGNQAKRSQAKKGTAAFWSSKKEQVFPSYSKRGEMYGQKSQ